MRKTVQNAIKICYSKRQRVSASGGLRSLRPPTGAPPLNSAGGLPSPDPLSCAVLKFPLKNPLLGGGVDLCFGEVKGRGELTSCRSDQVLVDFERVVELQQLMSTERRPSALHPPPSPTTARPTRILTRLASCNVTRHMQKHTSAHCRHVVRPSVRLTLDRSS